MNLFCKLFGHKWQPLESGQGTITKLFCKRCPEEYLPRYFIRRDKSVPDWGGDWEKNGMKVQKPSRCYGKSDIYNYAMQRSREIMKQTDEEAMEEIDPELGDGPEWKVGEESLLNKGASAPLKDKPLKIKDVQTGDRWTFDKPGSYENVDGDYVEREMTDEKEEAD